MFSMHCSHVKTVNARIPNYFGQVTSVWSLNVWKSSGQARNHVRTSLVAFGLFQLRSDHSYRFSTAFESTKSRLNSDLNQMRVGKREIPFGLQAYILYGIGP